MWLVKVLLLLAAGAVLSLSLLGSPNQASHGVNCSDFSTQAAAQAYVRLHRRLTDL